MVGNAVEEVLVDNKNKLPSSSCIVSKLSCRHKTRRHQFSCGILRYEMGSSLIGDTPGNQPIQPLIYVQSVWEIADSKRDVTQVLSRRRDSKNSVTIIQFNIKLNISSLVHVKCFSQHELNMKIAFLNHTHVSLKYISRCLSKPNKDLIPSPPI